MSYTPVDFSVNLNLVDNIIALYKLKPINSKREFEIVALNLFDRYLAQQQYKAMMNKNEQRKVRLEHLAQLSRQTMSKELQELVVTELMIKQMNAII